MNAFFNINYQTCEPRCALQKMRLIDVIFVTLFNYGKSTGFDFRSVIDKVMNICGVTPINQNKTQDEGEAMTEK